MLIILSIVIIALDRISKILALRYLSEIHSLPIIKGVFHLTLTENTGAAFSFLTGKTTFLAFFSAIVIIAGVWFYIRQTKKNPTKKLYTFCILAVLCGAIGNLIDRICYGYVVDFLDFTLINFPVFNVADCFITVGGIFMALLLIFDKQIDL